MPENKSMSGKDKGDMTVREAGHKGGQKVRELIEKGEEVTKKSR